MRTTLHRVQTILKDRLGVHPDCPIGHLSTLDDLGLDGLDIVELSMQIEREFGVETTDLEAAQFKTVGDVVACIEGKLP